MVHARPLVMKGSRPHEWSGIAANRMPPTAPRSRLMDGKRPKNGREQPRRLHRRSRKRLTGQTKPTPGLEPGTPSLREKCNRREELGEVAIRPADRPECVLISQRDAALRDKLVYPWCT